MSARIATTVLALLLAVASLSSPANAETRIFRPEPGNGAVKTVKVKFTSAAFRVTVKMRGRLGKNNIFSVDVNTGEEPFDRTSITNGKGGPSVVRFFGGTGTPIPCAGAKQGINKKKRTLFVQVPPECLVNYVGEVKSQARVRLTVIRGTPGVGEDYSNSPSSTTSEYHPYVRMD